MTLLNHARPERKEKVGGDAGRMLGCRESREGGGGRRGGERRVERSSGEKEKVGMEEMETRWGTIKRRKDKKERTERGGTESWRAQAEEMAVDDEPRICCASLINRGCTQCLLH